MVQIYMDSLTRLPIQMLPALSALKRYRDLSPTLAETRNALITGLTGQDGSYLAELLLKKGYRVFGLVRRLSTPNMGRIEHIQHAVELLEGDPTDSSSLV